MKNPGSKQGGLSERVGKGGGSNQDFFSLYTSVFLNKIKYRKGGCVEVLLHKNGGNDPFGS